MTAPYEDNGWVEDAQDAAQPNIGNEDRQTSSSRFDPQDLSTIEGITRLTGTTTPADLISRTRSPGYHVESYYQIDNLPRWRAWKSILNSAGGQEKWLFYACPPSMIEAVLTHSEPLPYGDFFPHLLGKGALYFFQDAEQAARTAFRYGVEKEGYLISCRVVHGNIFRTRQGNPQAEKPPRGYDTILAAEGTDLGDGPIACDTYALFDPQRILLRFVTHISRQ